MALNHVSFGNCLIFALALAEVTSWTIDLPEVRKFFFEKNKAEKRKAIEKEGIYYSNIESNSKHHEGHSKYYEDAAYAKEYGYQSYMEKKVNSIVYNGSVYLEGLRKSLLNYTHHLEGCKDEANQTKLEPPIATLPKLVNKTSCAEATRTSEHVRRLAQLALWATKELQDVAYSRKYDKGDPHELSQQENELILKLAWFLDRIAYYTGYEPQPKDFLHDHTTTTASLPPPPPMYAAPSPELKARLLRCLKDNSSEPAIDRCRYNETASPALQEILDMNDNITAIPTMPTPSIPVSPRDATAEPSVELLIASDNRTPFSNLPSQLSQMSAIRSKRSLSMPTPEVLKTRQPERSVDPMLHFLKYYTKHKVWQGANLDHVYSKVFETYDVKNSLSHNILKRAVNKKYSHLQIPEDPFQDLSKYVKHKAGVNYIKDEAQLEKIRAMLEEMHKKPSKINLRKLSKLLRFKRSVKYEQNVDKPRESVDPQKDISFYIKNKSGTNQNKDLVQAVLVRAGLEQHFNTGNIEVVRRYGANYNPLIPAPFFSGVAKTMADF